MTKSAMHVAKMHAEKMRNTLVTLVSGALCARAGTDLTTGENYRPRINMLAMYAGEKTVSSISKF